MEHKLEKHARKVRQVAESEARNAPRKKRRATDPQSAEAHNELSRHEHSKGQPAPDGEPGNRGKSRTGNDGP